MSNLEKILKDVAYFGVGAAATVIEAGGKVVKALVDKGEKTLRDNQDTVDDIVRKAKDFGEKVKDTVEKATAPVEEAPTEDAPTEDAPAEDTAPEAETPDKPVAPDAIYRTEIPAPEEESAEPAEEPTPAEPPILEIPEEDDPGDPFTRYNP